MRILPPGQLLSSDSTLQSERSPLQPGTRQYAAETTMTHRLIMDETIDIFRSLPRHHGTYYGEATKVDRTSQWWPELLVAEGNFLGMLFLTILERANLVARRKAFRSSSFLSRDITEISIPL